MKKMCKILVAILFALVLAHPVMAKDSNVDISLYSVTRFSVGKLAKYSSCSLGGGIAAEGTFSFFPLLGISGRAEFAPMIGLHADIKSWMNAAFTAGLYLNFPLGKTFILRPELGYGVQLHIVDSINKNLAGIYADQIIQFSGTVKIAPKPLQAKGFSFDVAPLYTLLTEKTAVLHYLGFRLGLSYQL